MKKLLILIAMLSAFISVPALAESIDSAGINRDTQMFEIEGNLGYAWANKKVSIMILNKDVEPDVLPNITNENIMSYIYGIYDTYADEKGSYSFSNKFEAKSGGYYALVNPTVKGGTPSYKYFKHFDNDEIEQLLEDLEKSRKKKDYSEIKGLLTDFNREMLGLPEKLYGGLGFEDFGDDAFECIANSNTEFKSAKLFAEEYQKAGVVNAFNKLSDGGKLDNLITECDNYLNITDTDIYDLYKNMDSTYRTSAEKFFADKADFTDVEQIADLFNKEVLLKTNEAFLNWTYFNEFITKYYSYFDVELTKYNKLGSKKSEVDKAIVGKAFESAEAFKIAFNTAVEVADEKTGNGGAVGSGSGIKSVGDRVEIYDTFAPVTPEVKEKFIDVPKSHWANEAITALAEKGIVAGKGNGNFDPDAAVSRKEAIKIIVLGLNIFSEGESNSFGDVSESDWAYPYISSAFAQKIVSGDDKGNYNPDAPVTRQDLAVLIHRAVRVSKYGINSNNQQIRFTDEAALSDYAVDAVAELSRAGVINGFDDGSFAPLAHCTRAQLAKMLYSIIK